MKKLILIKLGGSLITDKSKVNVARLSVIKGLVEQIKSSFAKASADKVSLIIATGAGGFGHPIAQKYKNNLKAGLPEIKKAVKQLNRIVVTSLNKMGIKAVSVEPSKISEYRDEKMTKLLYGYIVKLLDRNIIPVFHADLVNDQIKGISILSMDKFLVDVAVKFKNQSLKIEKIIFCGVTNGVLNNKNETIKKINKKNFFPLNKYFFQNNQIDTSGGMKKKVEECLRLIDKKIPGLIINGQEKNNLIKAISGEKLKGTLIIE